MSAPQGIRSRARHAQACGTRARESPPPCQEQPRGTESASLDRMTGSRDGACGVAYRCRRREAGGGQAGAGCMKPDPFVRIANSRDLVGHGPFALSASGVDVALVRTGAGWRAFQGLCPHQGALLGEGEIEGDRLVCRNHRWRFSLDSGRRDGGPECLASCPAVERDGAIFVDVSTLRGRSAQGRPDPLARRSARPKTSAARRQSPPARSDQGASHSSGMG